MKNYIILRDGQREHYYIEDTGGIYFHTQRGGFWSEPVIIEKSASGSFGLFADRNGYVHIISSNRTNDITYTLIRGEHISRHTILSGKKNVRVSDFQIKSVNGFLNLFYTAETGGELLLVHCILGNNSQPNIVSALQTPVYFLHGSRVYFTNESSVLGYCDYSDSSISEFIPQFQNAEAFYICSGPHGSHSTWRRGDSIILDGEVRFADKNASRPIVVCGENTMLMWESGGIVNYISEKHTPSNPAAPMRFISTGKTPELFSVQADDEFYYFYGAHSGTDVSIFGVSDVFSHCNAQQAQPQPEFDRDIEKLKIMIEMIQKEIASIKKQMNFIKQLYNE